MNYSWTDADYAALLAVAALLAIPPAWLVAMIYLESGSSFDPATHTTGSLYYGLNQISAAWLQQHGIAPSTYLSWSAAQQLKQAVGPYLQQCAAIGPLSTPGRLELAQLAPALLKNPSPSLVVFAAPSTEFESNKWLSSDGQHVTLADLERVMTADMQKPAVKVLLYEANEAVTAPASPITFNRVALFGGAAIAAAFFGTWAAEGFRR